jgi:glycosyltransferase 2 family protein
VATVRRPLVRLAQVVLTGLVLVYAGRALAKQWNDVEPVLDSIQPNWPLLAASTALVFASYVLLIEVWRAMLRRWGQGNRLAFVEAARIWFVSNLGKYLPGKVWQIGAMGVMAQRAGVSGVAAVGSSLVINLVNVITGIAIVLLSGSEVIALSAGTTGPRLAWAMIAAGIVAVVAMPRLIGPIAALASRLLRRKIEVPHVPAPAIWLAAVGTAVAWVLYGVAFALLARALVPSATGAILRYLAVFTGSYLAGYLALFAPGGLGVRELVLVAALGQYGLATEAQAAVIAVASRLWLTILEIVPGLIFLPGANARPDTPTVIDDRS